MNLSELGAYKHKVAGLFASDPDIIDLMLGPVDDDADTDEMLLGDDKDSCGHIYEFEYTPDINETTDTYLCMETVVAKAPTDTAYRVYLYVFAYCHKKIMQSYKKEGRLGTRADILAEDVDRLLNGNPDFGIGLVRLVNNEVYKPVNNYYGRCLCYEIQSFNRKRGTK